MLQQEDIITSGTYHVRLASMRASWFPEVVRRVINEIPDGSEAIIDLSDIGTVDRFSVRALAEAAGEAYERGIALAITARDPEIRRALRRERVDQWASIASDMTSARQLLRLIDVT